MITVAIVTHSVSNVSGRTTSFFAGYKTHHICLFSAAHVKTSLMGASLTVPITGGKLNLGTWQGIWLCEHRNHGSSRKIVVTMQGVQ